ncbi:MAG: hypothetical protein K0S39_5152, partial [Paenibacillus sp.]|nr:hypothetical protein [Paenibacillus sp.]
MIRNLFKLLSKNQTKHHAQQQPPENDGQPLLYPDLLKNEQMLRSIYTNCSDIIYRSFLIGGKTKAFLIYIEGLSDCEGIEEYVISPLMQEQTREITRIKELIEQKISVSHAKELNTFTKCVEYLSNGFPILLHNNEPSALALGLTKWEKRSIDEPTAEVVIRGPR